MHVTVSTRSIDIITANEFFRAAQLFDAEQDLVLIVKALWSSHRIYTVHTDSLASTTHTQLLILPSPKGSSGRPDPAITTIFLPTQK